MIRLIRATKLVCLRRKKQTLCKVKTRRKIIMQQRKRKKPRIHHLSQMMIRFQNIHLPTKLGHQSCIFRLLTEWYPTLVRCHTPTYHSPIHTIFTLNRIKIENRDLYFPLSYLPYSGRKINHHLLRTAHPYRHHPLTAQAITVMKSQSSCPLFSRSCYAWPSSPSPLTSWTSSAWVTLTLRHSFLLRHNIIHSKGSMIGIGVMERH
mmetsp:Transcript_30464/g.64172  ORF Transcript_30464/g.64172 Transcript_30464/m.64172 type:complete len:206 (-) Transcript_30464:1201-1818(-)